jgi:hypothetical protein
MISDNNAFDSLYALPAPALPSKSYLIVLLLKNPPIVIIGLNANVIKDIFHEKNIEIIIPIARPKIPYIKIEIVSVVNPFNRDISYDMIFVKTPGALSFESNQLISL